MTKNSVIEMENLSKTFRMGDSVLKALDDVSLRVDEGEFIAIVGPSGSGKSTLMNMIGLLDTPDQGQIKISGQPIKGLSDDSLSVLRSRTIGFVFQQFNLLPRTSAAENIGLPMLYSGLPYNRSWAESLLNAVGLERRSEHTPAQLSGGQQQRVAIARALVNKPKVVLADEPTGNLDSQSERDILDILVRLNQSGITVVIVTHEQEVMQIARRVIRMRDGKIISDDRQEPKYLDGMKVAEPDSESLRLYDESIPEPQSGLRAKVRKAKNYTSEAFRSVVSNKIRSFLSVLGILIGVAAVIAMLGLGEGARKTMEKQLSSLGSNLLVVSPGSSRSGMPGGGGSQLRLLPDDVDALKAELRNIKSLAPRVSNRALIQFEEKNWTTSVIGTTPEYATIRASQPEIGRNFSSEENAARSRVALIGKTVVQNIFGDKDPIGSEIKINRIYFQVIGILPTKGSNGFQDQDDTVIIPLETAMRRVFGYENIHSVDVQVDSPENMESVDQQIKSIVQQRKRLTDQKLEESLTVRNMADIQAAISSTNKIMSLLLSIIASISLLVGGIGVMNIMLVSVTERTREIGLRKALGATKLDILAQFLFEAALLGIIGGGLGVGFGWCVAKISAALTDWPFEVSITVVTIVTGITALVGIIFGFWPAKKAASLQPIQALKYE